jgi:uncharacterized protein
MGRQSDLEGAEPEQVAFYSDGLRLAGELYLPDGATVEAGGTAAEPVPAVVLCAGWVGGKYHRARTFARAFTERGFAFLSFEYRGWGQSEGDRTKLWPQEQTVDVLAAVSFLRTRAQIAPDRIALFGKEHGSAVALQAAVDDPAIAALAMMFPVGDGHRWMRSIRRPWEWRELLARIERDRLGRSATGISELMDPSDILLVDPATSARRREKRARSDDFAAWRVRVDSAEALLAFRPVESVHRLAPRPVLCIAVENDNTVPFDDVTELFDRFAEPKRMIALRGIEHYDAYRPEHLAPALAEAAGFFREAVAPRGR